MKNFIIKSLIIVCVLVGIDFVVGFLLPSIQHKSFEKDPFRFEVRTMYAIEKGNSEIDIIGSSDASHSYISNLIADSTGLSTYNYAKDGCFFLYQNCLINTMLDYHTPKVILWEIGKGCLASPEDINREWQSFKDFYPYYWKNHYVKKLVDSKDFKQRFFMHSALYRFNNTLFSIFEPYISRDIASDYSKGYLPLPNDGYSYPFYNTDVIIGENVDDNRVNLLFETLRNCNSKDIKVIFCFSPKYYTDYDGESDSYERLKQVADLFDVSVIDYRNSDLFVSDSTLFKDIYHLNDKGAHLYMKHFIPDLKYLLAD